MKLVEYVRKIYDEPDNKKLKLEYCKICYELFDKVNGEREELKKISLEEGVSVEAIYRNGKNYMKSILKMTDSEFYRKYVYPKVKKYKQVRPTPVNCLLLDLIDETNPEKIAKLIRDSGIEVGSLKARIASFVYSYFPNESTFLVDYLKDKVEKFNELEKSERKERYLTQCRCEREEKEQEFYRIKKDIFYGFILDDSINKEVYCQKIGITIEEFDKIRKMAQKYDLEMFQKYDEKIKRQQSQRWSMIVNDVKQLVTIIENGIEYEDGRVRTFDLIDYYENTRISFDEIRSICNSGFFSKNELRILKIFITKNKDYIHQNLGEVSQILDQNSEHIISGKVVCLEDKQKVIEFLRTKQIPQNYATYSMAIRRYLNGTLMLEENNNYKRVRKV